MPDQFTTSENFGPNKDAEHPSEVATPAEAGEEITQTGETLETNKDVPPGPDEPGRQEAQESATAPQPPQEDIEDVETEPDDDLPEDDESPAKE